MILLKEKLSNIETPDVPGRLFIVGGAVRDTIMGKEFEDVDFLVEGATEEEMIQEGFKKVGADFPVFLDERGREFALPRIETKVEKGHKGFEVETKNVTVKEDLKRRDFTMNALAFDVSSKTVIDPFNGKNDIERGIVRHVSDAFKEDPLRVLRLGRFASRFNFDVAEETIEIARETAPQLREIPTRRIILEIRKAMDQAKKPSVFFDIAKKVNALIVILPEFEVMINHPAGPEEFHEESLFEHTMMTLDKMNELRGDAESLLAVAFHDIGKIIHEDVKEFHGHGKDGADIVEVISKRLKMSNRLTRIIKTISEQHMRIKHIPDMKPSTLIRTVEHIQKIDGVDFELLFDVVKCDRKGRIPSNDFSEEKEVKDRIERAKKVIENIDGNDILKEHPDANGSHIGELLLQKRIRKLKELKLKSSI